MLDEQKIRQLEKQLEAKVEQAGKFYEKFIDEQDRYELSAEEIEKLRQEMEKERRATLAEN